MDDATAEHWLPVVGYEQFYLVSDLGRVRSLPRIVSDRLHPISRRPGRILKPAALKSGYLHLDLKVAGVTRTRLVHQLVMEAFVGPCPLGMETRHLDGNPANNAWPSNLTYGTHSENEQDKLRHGTHNNARKTHCKNNHEFTPENTYDNHGSRGCRQCHREACLRYLARKKARQEAA